MFTNYKFLDIFYGVQFFLGLGFKGLGFKPKPLKWKDMYFKKIIISYTNQFTFIFLKIPLWVMNKLILNFQNMTSM